MIFVGVNNQAPLHAKATHLLEAAMAGPRTVAFYWTVLLAFLRISTRPGLLQNPLPAPIAFQLVDAWLAQPSAIVLDPTPKHLRTLRQLVEPLGTAGNITSDAHLAALAIDHGAELPSSDNDFARFPGLRWCNPLA